MEQTNSVFEALADPTRRKILNLLHTRDLTPGEIIEHFEISKPALTFHLNVLKNAGLVIAVRDARNQIYSLNMSVLEEITSAFFDRFKKDTSNKS
jgi:ArsR family transcriptional regulator